MNIVNYSYALELFEEALNIKRHELVSRYTLTLQGHITSYLSLIYEKLAKKNWDNYNTSCMETSIEFLKKSKNLNRSLPIQSKLELYYYLYKAYNESSTYRTSNLENAKSFEEYGINVNYLYDKSKHITELYNDISSKQSNISNLEQELSNINIILIILNQ